MLMVIPPLRKHILEKLFKCFRQNNINASQDKCHSLSSLNILTKASSLWDFNWELKFWKTFMGNNWQKILTSMSILQIMIFLYMPVPQRKLLINAYFSSQFEYCLLVRMNHSRKFNDCFKRLNKALRYTEISAWLFLNFK